MADIPINPVTRRVQFTGNTGTGPFAFTFNILTDSDIVVYKNTTLLTLTTDYTITTNANGTGSITLTAALVLSDVLTIIGGRSLERTTDFVTAGDLLASSLNEQLDSLVIMAQQLDEKAGRTLRTNPGDEFTSLELPTKSSRLGTVLGFNATTGDPEAGPNIADVQTLADISADIALLADIEDGTIGSGNYLSNLGPIWQDITLVSANNSNVTAVANQLDDISVIADDIGYANINTVAINSSSIVTVGQNIADVNTVAGATFNLNTVSTNIADVNTLADVEDGTLATNGLSTIANNVNGILAVVSNSANITTVAGINTEVTTVAGISSDVTAVAGDTANIGTVATNIANVNSVGSNISNVNTVAGISSDVTTVAADGTDIGTVATNIANVNTVATNINNLTTLSNINADVSTVAGIASDVTTVAGISANVTTVAGISANVTTVAADSAVINTVATAITDVSTVSADIASVITAANDLNEAVSEIETVAGSIANVDLVGADIANVNTVAGSIANVNTVAGISANVTTVAGISANVTTVAGISGNVTTVAGISSDVTAVAADAADIGAVSTDIANVNTVAGSIANINIVAPNISNVNTVAGISSNVTTVAGISADVTAVAADQADIGTVSTNISDVTTVAGEIGVTGDVTIVAAQLGAGGAVTNVSAAINNVITVSQNLANVNNFAEVYRISANAPTTSLDTGDLWYDTLNTALKVYDGSQWTQGVLSGSGFLPLTGGTMSGDISMAGNDIYTNNGDLQMGTGTIYGNTFSGNATTATKLQSLSTNPTSDSVVFWDVSAGNYAYLDFASLDAGTLDGLNSTQFLRSDTNTTLATTGGAALTLKDTNGSSTAAATYINFSDSSNTVIGYVGIGSGGNNDNYLVANAGSPRLYSGNNSAPYYQNTTGSYVMWHQGNDGSGSGLDADTVDGLNASSFLRSDASDSGTTITLNQLNTNAIAKQTNGAPIVINSGLNASKALRVYYDMDIYNTINFTDASWNIQGRIAGSSGNLNLTPATGGSVIITSTNDAMLKLVGSNTWSGISFDDSGSVTDYIWYNGTYGTFAIGGGGSSVSGKKLHVDGGMTIGSGYDTTTPPTNGLTVEGNVIAANATFDNGTSTLVDVVCDDGGSAGIRLYGPSQGTGYVEVGQSTAYGGGMYYNGDGSPAFASGETADTIGFYRLYNGGRTEVFSYPVGSNNVTFNGNVTASAFYGDGSNLTNLPATTSSAKYVVDGYSLTNGNGGASSGWDTDGDNNTTPSDALNYIKYGDIIPLNSGASNAKGLFCDLSGTTIGGLQWAQNSYLHAVVNYNGWSSRWITRNPTTTTNYGALKMDSVEGLVFQCTDPSSTIVGYSFDTVFNVKGDGAFCSAFNAMSDIRIKENIELIDDPVVKLQALNGYSYNLTTNGKKAYGVIAQEVEEVLPHAVTESQDVKAVDYNAIVALLVETVKKQEERIAELEKKVGA